ncbi:MAG: ribosome maturation factor RimM [Eubacteriales bacterium]
MDKLLQVGVISSTHGLKGEAKVFPTTDDVNRFKKLKQVTLVKNGIEEILEIQSIKFFKKLVIVKFKGIDDIDEVLPYKGDSLYVTREQAVPCEKDEYFIADLIDLTVVDEEEKELGRLKEVIRTGANDVYVVELLNGQDCLIPAIKECILQIDVKGRKMKVHVMEGLLDS